MGASPQSSPRVVAGRVRLALDRAIRRAGAIDRNRFARVDARMSPDRLALPAPLALLLRK